MLVTPPGVGVKRTGDAIALADLARLVTRTDVRNKEARKADVSFDLVAELESGLTVRLLQDLRRPEPTSFLIDVAKLFMLDG